MLWFAQALVVFFRVLFRCLELLGPKEQRLRLRQLREKMDAINRDRDAVMSQMQSGDVFGGLEAIEESLGHHATPEDRAGLQETARQVRAIRQESETLRNVARRAGEDRELAVAGYRDYVREHPDSHAGFSYLGGALRRAGDLDGSLGAYQEAILLAGSDSIPGNSARLQLGMVLQEKGDIEAGIAEFQRIIDNATPTTEAYVCLAFLSMGSALNEMGRRSEARAAWKQAIKWDRTKIAAKQAREMLAANP